MDHPSLIWSAWNCFVHEPSPAAATASFLPSSDESDPDFDSHHSLLGHSYSHSTFAMNPPATPSSSKLSHPMVPSMPSYSTAVSDAVLAAVCICCMFYIASHTRPLNILALISYAILTLASGLGAFRFAGRGGEFIQNYHPYLAVFYRTTGIPCLGLAFTALTLPLVLSLQMFLASFLVVIHISVAIGRCVPRFAAVLPLPAILFILYTSITTQSYWGIAGVALFVVSAAVGVSAGSGSNSDAAAKTHAHYYMSVFGVGDFLRVDIFHYVLAAAVLCLAIPLVQRT